MTRAEWTTISRRDVPMNLRDKYSYQKENSRDTWRTDSQQSQNSNSSSHPRVKRWLKKPVGNYFYNFFHMKKYLIFLLIAIFSLPFASEMSASTSTGTTVKTSVKKKVVIKKPVKKIVKKTIAQSSSVITLNKPFKLWDVEYTILSVQMFDKVGLKDTFSDFKNPKNGKYLMIEFSYKNVSEDSEKTTWMMSILDGERMYDTNIDWQIYWERQMNWDSDLKSDNSQSYLPPWIKKTVFVSFDVPESVIQTGIFMIDWWYVWWKKVYAKLPIKDLK